MCQRLMFTYPAVVPGRAVSQVGRPHMKTRFHKKIAHFLKVPTHTGLTASIVEKEKEDTESHNIDELYEFSNDSSLH